MTGSTAPLLRMEGISKHYGGVRALEDVRFECDRGRIHALLGENGAGKSTLIKILAGVVQPDSGSIVLDGQPVSFATPAAANDAGIACIFQELSLLPDLTVADNIAITRPPKRFGLIDKRRTAAAGRSRRWPGSAARTSIRWRRSATCRCRAGRWSRSPRRSPAIPRSSSLTRRPRR